MKKKEKKFTQEDYDLINKEFEELRLVSLKRCANQPEYDEVIRAFEFANEAHKDVRRLSDVPYIIHPIAVAKIVVQEIGLGYKSIVAALLHDVVEDTDYTVEDIRRLFGDKIASLVDGLTKIKQAISKDKTAKLDKKTLQAENLKRIIITLNDDVRVVLIKLADRLHNLRTIDVMPEYKKDKILSETMFIFVPLAHRLGLYSIKSEMENIWLRTREPAAYKEIQDRIDNMISEKGDDMTKFIAPISEALKKAGYTFEIVPRAKTPYSIWNKMNTKGISFEQIYDLLAARIIFRPKENEDTTEGFQCWHILYLIKSIYESKDDRIRDWVSKPKRNGYEALHCTVMSNTGTWIEVQIRTIRMNDIAEKGVAAHWTYKDKFGETNYEVDRWLEMVRTVIENPDANALKFLDNFHDELLTTEIFVYTHKGESRSMPKGSTALDFAYNIHTALGNKAIAAKVDSKLVPLSYILESGDQIEIITAENQKPQREWLDFLITNRARNFVYEALTSEIKDSVKQGQKILQEKLEKFGIKLQSRVLRKLIAEYKVSNKEELYNKIAANLIDLTELQKVLKKNSESKRTNIWSLILTPSSKDTDDDEEEGEDISLDEIDQQNIEAIRKSKIEKNKDYMLEENPLDKSLSYIVADCCLPIPGDKIVGFLDDDDNVIIHKKVCPKAMELGTVDGERIISAKWTKHTVLSFLARISVRGIDRVGIVNDLTKFITLVLNVNMRKILIETHDGIFEGFIDIYVHNTDDIDALIRHIKKIKGVEYVARVDIDKKEN